MYTIAICAVESPTIEDFGEVIGMTKQETDNLKLILVSVEQGDIGILHSLGIKVRFVLTPTDTRHDSTFCILSTMTLKVSIMQQEFICPLGLLLPLLASDTDILPKSWIGLRLNLLLFATSEK